MAAPERTRLQLNILLDPELDAFIEDYRASKRPILTRSDAAKELLKFGRQWLAEHPPA